MKSKSAAALILAATLAAPALMAYAADDKTADRAHPATFVKDSAITAKVKAKLAAQNMKSLAHIKVDTDADGIVWLSGTAATQADIDKAEALVKDTAGVKSVKNSITVKAGA